MIRKYKKEDIPCIVALEEATLQTTLGYDFFSRDLESMINTSYVLEENNQIQGYISLAYDGSAVEILNFCMAAENQNSGVGTWFLSEILDIYYNLGATSVILEVRRSNLRAIHVYEKLGFKKIRIRKGYYSNGEDALVMQKLFVPIEDIEDAYLQCFATFSYHTDYVRVYDTEQPDKFYHNFYKIAEPARTELFTELCQTAQPISFIRFKTEREIRIPLLADFDLEHNIYMHTGIWHIKAGKAKNFHIKKAEDSDRKRLEAFLYEGLKEYGEEYSRRNALRLASMALDKHRIEYFILLGPSEEIIGAVHSFTYQDFAKIEEFVIAEKFRHRGYGSALFLYVVEYLKRKGIHDLVLCADNRDTPKTMYERMGFSVCGQYFFYGKEFENGKDERHTAFTAKENPLSDL